VGLADRVEGLINRLRELEVLASRLEVVVKSWLSNIELDLELLKRALSAEEHVRDRWIYATSMDPRQ
jgi:hypothetical protein